MYKKRNNFYIIHLFERNIQDREDIFIKHITPMHLDGVGFYLHHERWEQLLDHDWIRKHIVLRKESSTIINANSPIDAIQRFNNEWVGANIGGDEEEAKALWINRKKPIIEIPPCKNYWINKNGVILCGKPELYEDGCGCIFSGCDGFDDCPGDIFCKATSKKYNRDLKTWYYPIEPTEFNFNGKSYLLLSWKQLPDLYSITT